MYNKKEKIGFRGDEIDKNLSPKNLFAFKDDNRKASKEVKLRVKTHFVDGHADNG